MSIATVGGVSSTTTDADRAGSEFPRKSDERNSTTCGPSPTSEKGAVYGVQGPPSIPYSTEATPAGVTPPSAAGREMGVDEATNRVSATNRGSPAAKVVVGGVSSTRRVAVVVGSTVPPKSSLHHPPSCPPSPTSVNGPEAV